MKKLLLAEKYPGRRPGRGALLLVLLAGLGAGPAWAQVATPLGTDINAAPQMVRPDTATVRKPTKKQRSEQAAADSARRTERLFGRRVTPAQKAGLLAIVPGAGQIYNKKYWKLPIVYGMVGGLGYWVVYQQRYFSYFDYASSLKPIPVVKNGVTTYIPVSRQIARTSGDIIPAEIRDRIAYSDSINPGTYLNNGLTFYRRYRDLSILISGLGYGLQILDAVVDAHLSQFDVSDDLSLRWQPAAVPVPGQAAFVPGVVLTLHRRD